MENLNFMNLPECQQKKILLGDRFIPNRNAITLNNKFINNLQNDSPQNLLKDCMLDGGSLLNYSLKNQTMLSSFDILHKQQQLAHKNIQKKKEKRYFPADPEKILDAPDIRDDYYLNLIDWGTHSILAVALASSAYLLFPSGETVNLLNLPNQENYISSVAWMQNQKILGLGISDSTVQIWDTERETAVRCLRGHQARVSSLSWNGNVLSSGSLDKTIIHNDIRIQNSVISIAQSHQKEVCGLKWNPEGTMLASGGNDNTLFVWDAQSIGQQTQRAKYQINSHQAAVKALAWCPWQSNILASGGGTQDKCLKTWEYFFNSSMMTGNMIKSIQTDSQISSIEFSRLEKEIITAHGFQRNQISIWDYNSSKLLGELKGHTDRVLHISLNPAGDTLVSAATDETIRFWKLYSENKIQNKKRQFLINPSQIR